MPSLTENLRIWAASWDWAQEGDEWSWWWGGTPALWYGALLPRLHAFIPTGHGLEIGPGYGRWSAYLKDVCRQLTLVDLTPECIAACQTRFAEAENIDYHVNDGRSLDMLEDGSIDFAFSFDSLVHAEPAVLEAYLQQLARKLSPEGIGFIHHSNAGAFRWLSAASRHTPDRLHGPLMRRGVIVNVAAWRDEHMSARRFRRQCSEAGLACVGQELISWEYGPYLLDCLSFFTRPGSRWDRPLKLVRNPFFVAEGRRMARVYAGSAFSAA